MREINDLCVYILVAIDKDQRKQEIRTPSHTYMFLSLHVQVKICCSQQNAKNSFIYTFSYIVFIDSHYKNRDYRIEICAQ